MIRFGLLGCERIAKSHSVARKDIDMVTVLTTSGLHPEEEGRRV
jgi:hypothetical protein